MYRQWGKRLLDVAVSATALVVSSPLLILTGFCIWLEDRGAFLFTQARVGRDEIPFTIWKFRSMPVGVASVPSAEVAAPTVTRVGWVIRRMSLDEVPQLVNVLHGDMSLVGPRPALPAQAKLIELRRKTGATRLRPGLTGLAQIRSYEGMTEELKAAHDGEYASRVSLMNDLSILARTAAYLLKPPPRY